KQNPYEGKDDCPKNPETLFKTTVFLPLLDTAISSIEGRFDQLKYHTILLKHCMDLYVRLKDKESSDVNGLEFCDELSRKAYIKFQVKDVNLRTTARITNGMERKFFNEISLGKILYDICPNYLYLQKLKTDSIGWVKDFSGIFADAYIIPYMHVISDHMHEFQELDEDDELACFSLQGAEKYNDLSTTDYVRSTNKHHNSLEQMITKELQKAHVLLNEEEKTASFNDINLNNLLLNSFNDHDAIYVFLPS
ncbi:unnamed protein product, partial [Didymodactylos carnosus]